MAFSISAPNLFGFLILTSLTIENIRSASALECSTINTKLANLHKSGKVSWPVAQKLISH
jgi:hypothetical protein